MEENKVIEIMEYLSHGKYPSGSNKTDRRNLRRQSEAFAIRDGRF